ncbi:unnamed protein product [Allacma fusca]|uniref:Uncharacterized protein n=1 Tax=Allacma fusca TaxID=39272 RepID=A0A8J2KX70_9HEXA|nr:unnamed protein product [Allacma fusca]
MSSDDSPRANDNGNTELPTVSTTNSDSNHDFFLGSGGGTILGEFDKHSFSSKSSKTVNWAPILPGQNSSKPLSSMEDVDSLRSSNTNVQVHTDDHEPPAAINRTNFSTHQTQEHGNFNENSTIPNPGAIIDLESCKLYRPQDVSSDECPKDINGPLPHLPLQYQFTSNHFNEFPQHPQQLLSYDSTCSATMTVSSGLESDSVLMHHVEGEDNSIIIGGSECNSGNCQTPTLQQTSVSDYTLMSPPFDDHKSTCIFAPPAENYVYNAQVRLNNSGELAQETDQMTHNYPVARRDQNTGPDITTLPGKDNNLDNHNYDTDDDLGEPDPQASLLTLVNPKDLPVPDAEYVSRMVSEELHPYIAKKCKKDCRTWLWKSDAQRDAVVTKQRLETAIVSGLGLSMRTLRWFYEFETTLTLSYQSLASRTTDHHQQQIWKKNSSNSTVSEYALSR